MTLIKYTNKNISKHIFGYTVGLAMSFLFSTTAFSSELNIISGGYTDKGGEGIYKLTFDPATNKFGSTNLLTQNNNPSFGLQNNNLWYFVDESDNGQLLTYNKNEKGEFNLLQKNSVSGKSPCHISKRDDGKYITVSNYHSGNIAVFELDAKGLPQGEPQLKQHKGIGLNTNRQEAAHAHWAGWAQLPNNEKTEGIYVVDLGVDKIFWYPQNSKGVLEDGQIVYNATPGDGPRHMAFHPQKSWVYVLNELSNTLSFTQQDAKGGLTEIQKISTLPADFQGKNIAAHIVISHDGKHIYTSNRGDLSSISVFNIADDGKIKLAQNISSQGKAPRFFLLLEDAKKMLVANQDSDNLVAMNILPDGKLEYSGVQTNIPRPTFLAIE